MGKLTDSELVDLIKRRRDASVSYLDSNHAEARREALNFYKGENSSVYGDSGDGLSTVVSRDTFEAVESILPGLIKPFVSGDEAVRFDPREEKDEDGAQQATEYINYLFDNHNSAFRVTYDFAKDGLMFRLGVAKVVVEEVEESQFDTFQGLDELQYAALQAQIADDKTREIVNDPYTDETGICVQVKSTTTRRMHRVYVIAPEEFLHEDRLASLEDALFLGHRKNVTVGDLIAMGLPEAKCKKLEGYEPDSQEKDERFDQTELDDHQYDDDDLARKVTVTDAYIRCDYSGNGLEWRRVILGGTSDDLLLNEPAEDHPFVVWTPVPVPHKLIGLGIHDFTRDIQMQKTALMREAMNAMYLANRPMREVVTGQVNVDDLLNPTVGGIIRVKAPGMVREIESGGEGVAAQSLQMIEYWDTQREQRTGSTRYNQGMDANTLNKTATGISIIQNASQQRLEIIARQLAEAMQQIFKKMLEGVTRYADRKEVIRLRGKWVEMDPREWSNSYDASVSVGLGTGNKEQMAAHLTNLMSIQEQIAQAQGGLNGPLVTLQNVYEAAKQLASNLGFKNGDRFFTDPNDQQQKPQGSSEPDPNAEAQAKAQADIEKARLDAHVKVEIAKIQAEANILIAGMKAGGVDPMLVDAATRGLMAEMGEDAQAPQEPQEAQAPREGMEMAGGPQMAPQGPEMPPAGDVPPPDQALPSDGALM